RDHAHVIAAKAGLQGLTRALAADLAPQQVTVNMVSPGYIEASEDDPKRTAERRQHYAIDRIPLGHPGAPGNIAEVVTALAGAGFGYLTGTTLHVNGGLLRAGGRAELVTAAVAARSRSRSSRASDGERPARSHVPSTSRAAG